MQKAPPSPSIVVSGFYVLSDSLRVQVLDSLQKQELCVCDLCEVLKVTPSKRSFHLKVLKAAKLVQACSERRWIYYSLHLPKFVILERYLAEFRRFSPILPSRTCRD